MTISAIRTITLNKFSAENDCFRWPNAQVDSDEDYAVNAEFLLDDITDSIWKASARIQPSGDAELQALDLWAIGNTVAVRLANPVAGRLYLIELEFWSISGRRFPMLIELYCEATLTSTVIPPPFSVSFGTTIFWVNGVVSYSQGFGSVADNVLATGTNQATAYNLAAVVNIITDGIENTGVVLPNPLLGLRGTITIENATDTEKLLYPASGAQLYGGQISFGIDTPMVISPGQRLNATTLDPSIKWDVA